MPADRTLWRNAERHLSALDAIYRGTPDGRLLAIDLKTGQTRWAPKVMDPTDGGFATAAPLVWNGLIFIGKAGADRGVRGQMMAFKVSDGSKVWGF